MRWSLPLLLRRNLLGPRPRTWIVSTLAADCKKIWVADAASTDPRPPAQEASVDAAQEVYDCDDRTNTHRDYADSVARRALLDLALPSGGNDVVVALKGQRQ